MRTLLVTLALLLVTPAWALQVALLIKMEFDRGVTVCVYRTADGAIHRQFAAVGECQPMIYVP